MWMPATLRILSTSNCPNIVLGESLSHLFGRSGLRPSLVRGLRPRNAPGPTTWLVDLVSTSQPDRWPIERITPDPCTHSSSLSPRPCACPASLQKPVNNFSHSRHEFPARLFPPLIWDAHIQVSFGLSYGGPLREPRPAARCCAYRSTRRERPCSSGRSAGVRAYRGRPSTW